MRGIFLLFFYSVQAASDLITFDSIYGLEDVTTVEDGQSVRITVSVGLTAAGQAARAAGTYEERGVEFFANIGGNTAVKVETDRADTYYSPFKPDQTSLRFNASFVTDGDESKFDLEVSSVSIDTLDGEEIEIQCHMNGEFIKTAGTVYVWRHASSVIVTPINVYAEETESNGTDIANCTVEGAYPAPTHVTMSIGDHHYDQLLLENGIASLIQAPSQLTPGSEYDQKEITCTFDITVGGKAMATEMNGGNGTVIFTLEYATTIVKVKVNQDMEPLESWNGESWVERGDIVTVGCSADGNPPPNLILLQNGNQFTSGSISVGALTTIDGSSGEVDSDYTEFSCSSGNLQDTTTVRTHYMGDRAAFANGTHRVLTEGEPLSVICNAKNWNPPAKTSIEDMNGDVVVFSGVGDVASNGTFTCKAQNHFSTSSSSVLNIMVHKSETGSAGGPNVIVIIVIIVVVLVLIIGIGVFVYKKKQEEKGNDGTEHDEENPEAEAFNQPPPAAPRSRASSNDSDPAN